MQVYNHWDFTITDKTRLEQAESWKLKAESWKRKRRVVLRNVWLKESI